MKKVPNLRFKEFSDSWYCRKLNDILIDTRLGGNYKNTESITPFPLIKMGNLSRGHINLNKIEYITHDEVLNSDDILQKGDLLFNTRNTLDLVGKVAIWNNELELAYYNSNIMKLIFDSGQVSNNYFMNYLFNTKSSLSRLKSFATGTTSVAAIYTKDLKQMKIEIPSCREQEKIAAFFSLIDKKIELQTEKVEELKNYKKGLLQKIFSQELRFKDENGNEYPEWEEKTLQQIGFTYAGLSGKTKEDFGFGNGSFVTYINVFRNTLAKRMIEQVNISEQENQNPVLKGDLLFTTSSETPNEVGMVSCWDYEIKNLYLNSFCFGYRIYNHNSYSPIFLAYMLRSGEYRKKISILAQGSTRYNISKTELMKMKVQCPCMEEQQKIVALLLNLELKTEEEQNKLNELLQYKKGLLQQMFI